MMEKIEHIGIAVHSLEIAIPLYEKLLNTPCYKTEVVENQGVETAFFMTGPNKIELVAPTKADSPIAKYLEKKGEGIHHYAFLVSDIRAEIARLEQEGFVCINREPSPGADGMEIVFLHPKHTLGNLIELCQPIQQ
jgi:methylmalonyl-CoA/ethylmalonyl-CoA epimerase